MVLAHNLTAMNAQRQFNIVGTAKKKSTEKLSSGYKINRAADDAAGLSISEKMRKQIRGLDRASDNCQDGVSLCQVADGALAETHEILQRINELSIQSANGTNSSSDRAAIQAEVKQLTDEIDRIATTTSFNERIFPLKGTSDIKNIKVINYPTLSQIRDVTVWCRGNSSCDVTLDGVPLRNNRIEAKAISLDGKNGFYDVGCDAILKETAIYGLVEGNKLFSLTTNDLKTDANGYVYYESKFYGKKAYLFANEGGII